MKILALILLAVGAVIAYGSKMILGNLFKRASGEKEIAILKTVGLLIALAGAIIIFVYC